MGHHDNDGDELALYAINDGDLYREAMRGIIPGLAKKAAAGRYDRKLAVVLWEYHAEKAARAYAKEIEPTRFNAASRMVAARRFEEHYREAVEHAASGGSSRSVSRRRVTSRSRTRTRSRRDPDSNLVDLSRPLRRETVRGRKRPVFVYRCPSGHEVRVNANSMRGKSYVPGHGAIRCPHCAR